MASTIIGKLTARKEESVKLKPGTVSSGSDHDTTSVVVSPNAKTAIPPITTASPMGGTRGLAINRPTK
jgi:hypothetical protein